jgi:filamentous hemagglutinin family protein
MVNAKEHTMSRKNLKNIRSNTLTALVILAGGGLFSSTALAGISATALPANGTVTAGQATITTSGNTENINENGNAVIAWNGGFDVGSQATVNFSNAGSGNATVLNVDNSGNISEIAGTVNGTNTNIIIANNNGVMVDGGATINNPGGGTALIGGVVYPGASFASTGRISWGATQAAPVTISNGATVNSKSLILAGTGDVNVGAATYNIGSETDIIGGQESPEVANKLAFSNAGTVQTLWSVNTGYTPDTIPTTINIEKGAVLPMVNDIWNGGNSQNEGSMVLDGTISSENNGTGITFQGNGITGPGMIVTNDMHFSKMYGSVNNPNGGGTAANHWVQNHLNFRPHTNPASSNPNPGFTNIYFGTMQNNGPQYFNLWVNGNAGYFFSESTLNSPQAGSQLRLQASGEVVLGPNAWAYNQTTGQGPALYGNLINTTQNPTVSWPGLIAAVSNINANGTLESAAYQNPNLPNGTEYQEIAALAPIDNAMAPGVEPGGNGIFMQAPTVGFYGGVTVTGHPVGYSDGFNALSNWQVVAGQYFTDQWTNLSSGVPGKSTDVEYVPSTTAIIGQPKFTSTPFVAN